MHPIRISLLALSLAAASCASIASDTPEAPPALGQLESKTYLECMKKANGRLEKGNCINGEVKSQREQLDQLSKKLSAKLNDAQRAELARSQMAWEAFMDAESRFAASFYDSQGGSADLTVGTNKIRWIAQRRQQLQSHLDF